MERAGGGSARMEAGCPEWHNCEEPDLVYRRNDNDDGGEFDGGVEGVGSESRANHP